MASPARIEIRCRPRNGPTDPHPSFNIAYSTPEQYEKNLRNDVAIFTKVVKKAALRPN